MFLLGACRTFQRVKTGVCLFCLQINSLGEGRDTYSTVGQDDTIFFIALYNKCFLIFDLPNECSDAKIS